MYKLRLGLMNSQVIKGRLGWVKLEKFQCQFCLTPLANVVSDPHKS